MALRLEITYPDGETTTITITADETILGRDPGQGITLPDAKASRRHARILKRDEAFWVEDLGSSNGLLLDGLPLSGQALLASGAVLELGDTRLVATLLAESLAPASPSPASADDPRYAAPFGGAQRQGTRFALKVVEGELLGQTFTLDLEETIVGRGLDATLPLEATSISRKHAVIRVRDDHSVSVEDLGSSNGTYVGELALDGVTILRLGEQIRFGTLVLELVRAEEPATPAPQASPPKEERAKTTRPVSLEAPDAAPSSLAHHAPAGRNGVSHELRDPAERTAAVKADAFAPASSSSSFQPHEARRDATPPESSLPRSARLTAAQPLTPMEEPSAPSSHKESPPSLPPPRASATDASERPTEPAPASPSPEPVAPVAPVASPPARMGPSPTQAAWQALGRLSRPLRASWDHRSVRRALLVLVIVLPVAFGLQRARHHVAKATTPPWRDVAREAADKLLGYGPLREERQWRARREAEWAKADTALHDGDWEGAQAAMTRSLQADATYPPSLALRAKIDRAVRAETNAAQAMSLRSGNRWGQALMAASDALADFENDGRANVRKRRVELQRIVMESRQRLGAYCSEEARIACGQERYENCVSQAACALGYRQNDAQALACLNLAASVTDAKNGTRPISGQGKDDGVDVGPAPAIDAQAAAAQYPDSKIRLAMLTYAAGSTPLAMLRLRNIDDPASRAVLTELQAAERAQTEAATQEQKGDFRAALAAWERALATDARLIPKDVASGPRALLTANTQRMYLTLGDAAFASHSFEEALTLWQQGLARDREYLPLTQALDKLDAHAQSVLDEASIARRNRNNKDVCQLIEQAIRITPDDSPVHKTAEEALGSCRRAKPAGPPSAPPRD